MGNLSRKEFLETHGKSLLIKGVMEYYTYYDYLDFEIEHSLRKIYEINFVEVVERQFGDELLVIYNLDVGDGEKVSFEFEDFENNPLECLKELSLMSGV